MVYSTHSSGVGSNIHVAGFHAAHAWRNGRVLLWGETLGMQYTDAETCGPEVRNWRCHFRAESSCSVADAKRDAGDTIWVENTNNPLNPRTDLR